MSGGADAATRKWPKDLPGRRTRKQLEQLREQGMAFRASGFGWADVAQLIGLTEYETVQLCASEAERERWERKREGVAA